MLVNLGDDPETGTQDQKMQRIDMTNNDKDRRKQTTSSDEQGKGLR